MTFQTTFIVYGQPQGKARPRFTRTGRAYTPKKTADYEDEIRLMAKAAMGITEPLETPIAAYIYISMPVPQSYSKKRSKDCLDGFERPTKRPDTDNIVKAFLDACNGIVYKDDAQVVSLHATKVFGETASVQVLFKEELS